MKPVLRGRTQLLVEAVRGVRAKSRTQRIRICEQCTSGRRKSASVLQAEDMARKVAHLRTSFIALPRRSRRD